MRSLTSINLVSFSIWVISLSAITTISAKVTNLFRIPLSGTPQSDDTSFIILYTTLVIVALLAGIVYLISLIFKNLAEKKYINEGTAAGLLISVIKFPVILPIYPYYLLYHTLGLNNALSNIYSLRKSSGLVKAWSVKSWISSLIASVLIIIFIIPVWTNGLFFLNNYITISLGYVPEPIKVSGTGSMYPTFPKGQGKDPKELAKEIVGTPGMIPYPNGILIGNKRYFGYELSRGDIVVFVNEKTRMLTQKLYGDPTGWVKRVVALPGDKIELKSGIVYLNSKPLEEPYIAKARSTFGQDFLSECKEVLIPEGDLFVMGDNRKGSRDSREIGFIDIKDIHHVLPLKDQYGVLDEFWRDTSKDFEESSKITLDKKKYLQLINAKRTQANKKPLIYQPKLEKSAAKRGEVILKYDDLSFEATRSGYTMKKAMTDAAYSNIVYGEVPILGYFEAEELVENQFEFPDSKEFLLESDYQEMGVAEVEGKLNGCPAQVLVLHFAGYKPPDYKSEDIDTWKNILDSLNSVIPSWEKGKGIDVIDQNELDKLLNMLYKQRNIARNILQKMQNNEWLTKEEEDSIKEFETLSKESSELAKKLNEGQ